MRTFLPMLLLLLVSTSTFAAGTVTSARSPEVLASYDASDELIAGLEGLKPRIQMFCKGLLESQLRLQAETDSWKLYSLYEVLAAQDLMTSELLRVPTVTEIAAALPHYTNYRKIKTPKDLSLLKSGSIIVADKSARCGPDPLAVTKGAYFLKCGEFLIGSGLTTIEALKKDACPNLRTLQNQNL